VQRLKHGKDDDLYMPLIYFVFEKEIAKYYATKKLTKGFKESQNSEDQECSDQNEVDLEFIE